MVNLNPKESCLLHDVTLLITHYNRSNSLSRLLDRLSAYGVSFYEIVISDDCSSKNHLDNLMALKAIYPVKLVLSDTNKGLGNNLNKGLDVVKTPFILYLQEDFVPTSYFALALKNGITLMRNEPQWDIVRFYSFPWAKYPYLKKYKNGFSRMKFSLLPWYNNHLKFFYYSDHPHLKRRGFVEKFGPYKENCSGDKTEWAMCMSFLHNKGKGLYYDEGNCLFEHVNDANEPAQFRKESTYSKLLDNKMTRSLYLNIKTLKQTLELLFYSKKKFFNRHE